jgi:hypothetical protein
LVHTTPEILKHIYGHQDKQKTKLTKMAILNIKADSLATKGLQSAFIRDIVLPTDKAILYLNNKKVASNFTLHLREKFSATQMYQYYQEKHGWSNHIMDKIWWEAHGAAIETYGLNKRMTIHKFIHDRAAVNVRESKFYPH